MSDIISITFGLLIFFGSFYYLRTLFILDLSKTLNEIPEDFHAFPNWFLWALFVPGVHIIFSWIILPFGIPRTLQAAAPENSELQQKAKTLFWMGLALVIALPFFILSSLLFLSGFMITCGILATLILWIMYWTKIVSARQYISID